MGRITVFTGHDMNSRYVRKALQRRSIPFVEISLASQPSKVEQLHASGLLLGDVVDEEDPSSPFLAAIVPQIFFNERHVGGLSQCVSELQQWDALCEPQKQQYANALEVYRALIEPCPNPRHPVLISREDFNKRAHNKITTTTAPSLPPPRVVFACPMVLQLPDGTEAPVGYPIVMELRRVLRKRGERVTMTGQEVLEAIQERMALSYDQALAFAKQLCIKELLQPVGGNNEEQRMCRRRSSDGGAFRNDFENQEEIVFQPTSEDNYHLQCDSQPSVLNSFLRWNPKRDQDSDRTKDMITNPVPLMEYLCQLISHIELSSLTSEEGLLDVFLARQHELYPTLQESVCALQAVHVTALRKLSESEMTAWALNLFHVMTRYAHLKLGIPTSEQDRFQFSRQVQFDLAGRIYSLHEWVDDVLRGAVVRKSRQQGLFAIRRDDPRLLLALHIGAHEGTRWNLVEGRFTAENLNSQLARAAYIFCKTKGNVRVRRKARQIILSSLWRDYTKDLRLLSQKEATKGGSGGSLRGAWTSISSVSPSPDAQLCSIISGWLCGSERTDFVHVLASPDVEVSYHAHELGSHTKDGPWYESWRFEYFNIQVQDDDDDNTSVSSRRSAGSVSSNRSRGSKKKGSIFSRSSVTTERSQSPSRGSRGGRKKSDVGSSRGNALSRKIPFGDTDKTNGPASPKPKRGFVKQTFARTTTHLSNFHQMVSSALIDTKNSTGSVTEDTSSSSNNSNNNVPNAGFSPRNLRRKFRMPMRTKSLEDSDPRLPYQQYTTSSGEDSASHDNSEAPNSYASRLLPPRRIRAVPGGIRKNSSNVTSEDATLERVHQSASESHHEVDLLSQDDPILPPPARAVRTSSAGAAFPATRRDSCDSMSSTMVLKPSREVHRSSSLNSTPSLHSASNGKQTKLARIWNEVSKLRPQIRDRAGQEEEEEDMLSAASSSDTSEILTKEEVEAMMAMHKSSFAQDFPAADTYVRKPLSRSRSIWRLPSANEEEPTTKANNAVKALPSPPLPAFPEGSLWDDDDDEDSTFRSIARKTKAHTEYTPVDSSRRLRALERDGAKINGRSQYRGPK